MLKLKPASNTPKLLIALGVFIFLALISALVFAVSQYSQSSSLKNQADTLLNSGHTSEAIEIYMRARAKFPFRSDIASAIAGAQLIQQSEKDYDTITDFAEIQLVPDLDQIPTPLPGRNGLFVPMLMYHHIEANPKPGNPIYAALFVTPQQLEQQLAFFSSHDFHTISLDELNAALTTGSALPKNPIILTFDDGYRSFYDNAFPLLKKYQMKSVQFVITQVETAPAYLTWPQIVEMDKSGLVEIGAHTRHHANLPDYSLDSIKNEVRGSKDDIESHLNHRINWFAYPYGSYSPAIIQAVKDAGFLGAASTIYGTNQSLDTAFLMPRIMVDGRLSVDNLARRVQHN